MADIRPFQGIRYNEQLGVDLGQLLCPPYDVISPALQQKLYETNPYNIVRLELGKDTDTDSATDNKYSRAATLLNSWVANRIMVNDAMDIIGGAGIVLGPRNLIGHGYMALPIGITVEGSNTLKYLG